MSSKKKENKKAKQAAEGPAQSFNKNVRFNNKLVKDGLRTVSQHHIDAFDYAMQTCLPRICKYMLPVELA